VGGIGGAGGPAGGGAASFVADRAASASARAGDLGRVANFSARRGGSGNNPSCGTGRPFQAWTQGGGGALSGGPARGERYAVSFGIERDLADMTGMACGQLAAGLFGGLGRAHSEWGTGTSDTASRVTGGYLNYVSENGFYMSALGAVSWSSTGIDNALFGSTAEQSSIGVAGIAAVGHVMPLTMDSAIDWRAYAAHGLVDGDGFTDTLGVVNDGSEARITTFGLSAAYRHGFSDRMRGFAQAGVKWARVDRKASAFGTAYRGATEALFGSVAAGFSDQLTAQASLAASIHADFSAGTIAYGGDVRFRLRF
ncbi:MAG: autotransporter outer membrane beta-barrel domain-containing protein, partial [Notoacmeibacter sp.]|nr:autotransporter outer membrane beta-barrel domain-containing protein [Notoacmeibacter sp.]